MEKPTIFRTIPHTRNLLSPKTNQQIRGTGTNHNRTILGSRPCLQLPFRSVQNPNIQTAYNRCFPTFPAVTVMNIITWSHAISLYPFSTFEMRLGLISNFTSTRARRQVIKKKYALRGFLLTYNPGYFLGVAEFHRGSRYVGDKYSWIIPLVQHTGKSRHLEDLAENSWQLSPRTRKSAWVQGLIKLKYFIAKDTRKPHCSWHCVVPTIKYCKHETDTGEFHDYASSYR